MVSDLDNDEVSISMTERNPRRLGEYKSGSLCSRPSASSLFGMSEPAGAAKRGAAGADLYSNCSFVALAAFPRLQTMMPASTMTRRPSTPPTTPPIMDVFDFDLDCPPAPKSASVGWAEGFDSESGV